MKKNHLTIIGIAILVIVAGSVYYFANVDSLGYNISNWVQDESNAGQWKVDIALNFADGTTKYIDSPEALSVTYLTTEMVSAVWYLHAIAMTPDQEPYDWDEVQIDLFDLGTFELGITVSNGIYTQTITPEIAGFDNYIYITVDDWSVAEGWTWATIFEYTIDFDDIFDVSDPSGTYTLTYTPTGVIYYKGLSSYGDGPWTSINVPSSTEFIIEYTNI